MRVQGEDGREADVFMSEWTDIVVVSYVGASESPSGSCQLSQNPGAKREWRGRPTGNGCIHEYLDLNMNRGAFFYHEYE